MRDRTDELISAIAERARTPGMATSIGPARAAYAPVPLLGFEKEEQEIGFPFPGLLKRLYTEVGNGGFGPGYGLLSIARISPADRPILHYYSRFRAGSSRGRDWTAGIIPFNEWGDLILSCVDLSDPGYRNDPPVIRFEPNMPAEHTHRYLKGKPFHGAGLIPEAESLSQWFRDWLDGKEMFKRPYSL